MSNNIIRRERREAAAARIVMVARDDFEVPPTDKKQKQKAPSEALSSRALELNFQEEIELITFSP